MRRLTLAIALLAAAPALAQPASGRPDWTNLVVVDGTVTVTDSAGSTTYIVQSHASSQSLIPPIVIQNPEIAAFADTPLPPPCEPPPVRSIVTPPEPSSPPPAPCRP